MPINGFLVCAAAGQLDITGTAHVNLQLVPGRLPGVFCVPRP